MGGGPWHAAPLQPLDQPGIDQHPVETPRFRAANLGDEANDLETLKTKYKVDLFVPPKEQIDALTARMQPYWEQWAASQGANGTAMLKEIRSALG